jgi:hypothetical protein
VKVTIQRDKRFRLTGAMLRDANAATKKRVGLEMKELAEKTVATWTTDVAFSITETQRSAIVETDNEVWQMVNKGTKAHVIPVGQKGFLAFQADYTPKTQPGNIAAGQGGASGEWIYTRKPINHPGTKARRFDKAIADELRPKLRQFWREELAKIRGG